jgi:uncharacterized protein (TIGR03437 family)
MTKVSMDDNGWMAAVTAPLDVVQQTLAEIDGYVVPANINSNSQCVIGGASQAVQCAIEAFTQKGIQAQRIPVSHAFHTKIVAPAAKPLRQVLDRLHVAPPRLPLVANVTGEPYPQRPDEIRAQLPSDIAEGPQSLTVRWEGKPETSAPFTVARNAPGLFYKDVEGRHFGVFIHEDGQAVSAGSPAHRGETITLIGTGLGPFKRLPPDGFLLPETADFGLADPVELIYGESVATPLYAGSTSVAVGLNAVRFRVTDDFPSGAQVPVKVRVNGVESNTVLLPVE